MSKVLAGYVLAVVAAHEAAYDREASDAAVEGARVRAREKIREEGERSDKPKISPVTLQEIRKRIVKVSAVPHTVEVCFKGGDFTTNKGFRGNVKNVRRLGRGYVYVTEEYAAEMEQQRVDDEAAMEFIDFAQFQRKTLWQVAEEIVPHLYRQPVYLLLQTAWNDALDWANEAMKLHGPEGEDQHNFRLGIETPEGVIDYQLSAQDELSAAFKLGQIFHENLSLETVKLL